MIDNPEICAELYFILEQVPNSYIKLLPENFMYKLKEQMSTKHYKIFDTSKIFYKQDFNDASINLLNEIYQKYWIRKVKYTSISIEDTNTFKNINNFENVLKLI